MDCSEIEEAHVSRKQNAVVLLVGITILAGLALLGAAPSTEPSNAATTPTVRSFGAVGDGQADDTAAVQRAVDAGTGLVHFPPGTYRLTRSIVIDLDRVGYTSLTGDGVAQIVMAGPGPALRFVGTHAGTADPPTFKDNVWQRQRMPAVDGLEIVGAHEDACGVEATGTMQLTLTRLVVRKARHAVHLVERNRNVVVSACHLYDNSGIGVFLDGVNLHQINLTGCHISYNQGGGVVARGSELRNLQIGACDIEANMGGPDSEPTANVWLDSTGNSVAEVAIVGCTLQHTHNAPGSANIRIDGRSKERAGTDELRHGHVTIADNILSDVQVNVEVRNSRAVTITGNTMWQAYAQNLIVDGCTTVVVANNVFDRNPRYHYGDGAKAKLGIELVDSADISFAGNVLHGVGDVEAAVIFRRCQRANITGCNLLDYGRCGLLLDDVSRSRVSGCIIRDDRPAADGVSVKLSGGRGNMIVDNLLGTEPQIDADAAIVRDNTVN